MKKLQPNHRRKFNPKQAYKDYTDRIHNELEEKGVVFFCPEEQGGTLHIDTEYLTLPQDITSTLSHELGNYLNAFTQQKLYMRTLLGWAESYMDEAKKDYFDVSKDLYSKLSGSGKLSETAKERTIVTDPKIAPFYHKYQECIRKVSLIQSAIENIEDSIFLISREISRRTSDFNNENRNYNVGK